MFEMVESSVKVKIDQVYFVVVFVFGEDLTKIRVRIFLRN